MEARQACGLGEAWFGDGSAPAGVRAGAVNVTMAAALDAAATLLAAAARPLVYLAPDLSCEAQREGVAIADAVRARLDSVTTATVLMSMLAQQERGRASATLGEVRNRADVVVFWGVDPAARYPRYSTRYAPQPAGLHVPEGRRSRTVVAVDIGDARGPEDADIRVSLPMGDEVAVLALLTARVSGTGLQPEADVVRLKPDPTSEASESAVESGFSRTGSQESGFSRTGSTINSSVDRALLLKTLLAARYAVVVADAEPDPALPQRDGGRSAALIALTQALNARTRCALSLLRGGGNRSGADAVMTWQTGYPMAADFRRGSPAYRPHDALAGSADIVLLLGSASSLPAGVRKALAGIPAIVIGPRATDEAGLRTRVAIDSAIAGIHEGGTAFRMDDVPVPLRPPIAGPPAAAAVLTALRGLLTPVKPAERVAG